MSSQNCAWPSNLAAQHYIALNPQAFLGSLSTHTGMYIHIYIYIILYIYIYYIHIYTYYIYIYVPATFRVYFTNKLCIQAIIAG